MRKVCISSDGVYQNDHASSVPSFEMLPVTLHAKNDRGLHPEREYTSKLRDVDLFEFMQNFGL